MVVAADTDKLWQRAAEVSALSGEGPFGVVVSGIDIVLVRTNGEFRAYRGACPHQGALLGEGRIEGDALVCRNHGWRFDLDTGERIGASGCLRALALREHEGWLEVGAEQASEKRPTKRVRSLGELPGPPGLPLIGNAHQLQVSRLHQVFENWASLYGSIYRYDLARTPFLVVSDPSLVNEVLRKRPTSYRKISTFEQAFAELGIDGVFVAEGDSWRRQRRLVMQALDTRNLGNFFPVLREVGRRLKDRWSAAADKGLEVDILDDFTRFTVDVSTSLSLAQETNTLEGQRGELLGHLAPIFPTLARRLNSIVPWWRYFSLPSDRRADRSRRALRQWLGEVVAETRTSLRNKANAAAKPDNFLEAMLLARDANGEPFSEDTVFANAMTMLLAGEDTTANTLSWAIHLLLDSPGATASLRSRVDAVLGEDVLVRDLEMLEQLDAVDAFANETLRLKPVAPFFLMENCVDVTLGDVFLPQGTAICLLTRVSCLDPEIAPDPTRFDPTRWADETILANLQRTGAFVPFGSGPRSCPGRTMALFMIRLAISTLLRNFEIERVGSSADVSEHFGFVMTPEGLRVRLQHRQSL